MVRSDVACVLGRPPARCRVLHIDCELYSSTRTVLRLLKDRIKPGCVIVFDEYFNYPGWEDKEFKAFREFISETRLAYEYVGYNRLYESVAVIIKGEST